MSPFLKMKTHFTIIIVIQWRLYTLIGSRMPLPVLSPCFLLFLLSSDCCVEINVCMCVNIIFWKLSLLSSRDVLNKPVHVFGSYLCLVE